ncbi:hypothetical protein Cgig2_005176 [Carnegiea gigantea]|uniref:DUF668 domain-containing protein n=1 Tax=Carnegiea gigantea TaxID=171969 RepID=A0A9Q1KG60_9CARY|nr:hypothetical protein Cgig2_005176 [Carnegiea gigantea]
MGLLCSKNFSGEEANAVTDPNAVGRGIEPMNVQADSTAEQVRRSFGTHLENLKNQQPEEHISNRVSHSGRKGSSLDDFYDGIPLVPTTLPHKSRSRRSTQAAVAKVSEVSLRLGRAGTMGLEKAVEVLDVLGSSMTDLNPRSGFASGVVSKGTKISILAFEIANTVMKGARLMHSLSESHLHHLKEEVLPSEAVQKLVSKDEDELIRIVATDKREELSLLSGEVIRFGNRCKDPQWHNLDRYILKQSRDVSPHKQLKEDAKSLIQQLMILVQYTAELYHELHALHRFEQDCQSKCKAQAGNHGTMREELKRQKKLVRKLKKRSLWSRSLEEVLFTCYPLYFWTEFQHLMLEMALVPAQIIEVACFLNGVIVLLQIVEKLVDVVLFLHIEICDNFDDGGQYEDPSEAVEGPVSNDQRLGPAGLALHYANIILQIDGIVARSCSMPANARESLYQSLPPSIKSSLRSRLQSFHVKEELTVTEIKAEMEKTLQWLVPIASNTVKFVASETPPEKADPVRIETLYHADKVNTEAYITDQLVWLHYLVSRSQANVGFKSTIKAPAQSPFQRRQNSAPKVFNVPSDLATAEDHDVLNDVSTDKQSPEISESQVSDGV